MIRVARLFVLFAAACSSASPPRSNDGPVAASPSTLSSPSATAAIDLGAEPGGELPPPPPKPSAAQVQEAWAALLARFKEEKLSGFVLLQQKAPMLKEYFGLEVRAGWGGGLAWGGHDA